METEVKTADLAVVPSMLINSRQHLPWVQRIEDHASWPVLARVPQTVTALVQVANFTLHDLLTMERGRVIESSHPATEMIPLKIGAVRIAWGEFEVVEHSLALRVTKLA